MVANVPTLTQLKAHIARRIMPWYSASDRMSDVFYGRCDEAARWMLHLMNGNWFENDDEAKVFGYCRGWFTDTAQTRSGSWIRNAEGCIAHSWLEVNGQIIDPTQWAFYDTKPRVAIVPATDPRYIIDYDAD